MAINPGGLDDRWYPVIDVGVHGDTPTRLVWTDAAEAYLSNLPASYQGLSGRMDQDRTICDECGDPCLVFAQAPGASRRFGTFRTNAAHVSTGTSYWQYGTTLAASRLAAYNPNILGAASWLPRLPDYPSSGWVGTTVASSTPGASRTDSVDNYYSYSFSVNADATFASIEYQVCGSDSVTEIWANDVMVTAPPNGPNDVVTGQISFVPLQGFEANWVTVKVVEQTPGVTSAHGFMGYIAFRTVSAKPFTDPIDNDMWWVSPTRPESAELLGFRVWPGTEIVVAHNFAAAGSSDSQVGTITCGKVTLTATIQIVATSARGSQYGIDLLLSKLTNSCGCGGCNGGLDLSLYAGCDINATDVLSAENQSRRVIHGMKLTGWQDMELSPPMPSHIGRLITITMASDDGRLWADSETIFDGWLATMATQVSGTTTNQLPGPRYTKTYTYLRDRTAWPVQFNNDGTATPVGNWSTLTSLQPALGATNLGEGFIFADSYYRVDPSTHPVRIVYDRTAPLFYYETIGWTWPTGVPLPCDFDVEIVEFAQRMADDTSFDVISNPDAACTFYVQPGAPANMTIGAYTIAAQGANASRGPVNAVGPYAGSYIWAVDDEPDTTYNQQINLGCHFSWFRPVSECPPSIDTNPAISALPVTVTVAANGQMTWIPTPGAGVWTYAGGAFPPQNRSFIITNQIIEPISTNVTVVSDDPACSNDYLCFAPVPPIRPLIPWEVACQGGINNTPGSTLYALYTDMVIPDQMCATLRIDLQAVNSNGDISIMVFDITDLGPTPTMDQMWLEGFNSVADLLPSEGDNRITTLDGIFDTASLICGAGEPAVDFEPWGTHGIWVPPTMMGGRKYRLCFIGVGSTAPAVAYNATVQLATYSRG